MKQLEKLKILYEDNHLIAVNKWNGIAVHDDDTGARTLEEVVKYFIKIHYDKPGEVYLGVIHRIDKPVSGLVLFAKSSKALIRMNEMMQKKEIEKKYLAIVEKRPELESNTLTHHLVKDEKKNYTHAYTKPQKNTKEAVLKYRLINSLGDHHLLEIELITGRPHQIRAQLSKIGCPIKGDVKYGSHHPSENIYLHSYQSSFIHPVKKEKITITAEPPKDNIWKIFENAL